MVTINSFARFAAGIAIASASAASQALSFTTEESGNFSTSISSGAVVFSSTFTVFTTQSTPAGISFEHGTFNWIQSAGTNLVNGQLVVYGNLLTDYLQFDIHGQIFGPPTQPQSMAGTAVLTGANGAFAFATTGAGNVSTQSLYNDAATGTTFGSFSADVQASPEPITCGLLGLGIWGLLARRRVS